MDKDKIIDFRKTQWSTNVNTLNRIKEDEQKWLFYAFATFGALISLYLSGKVLFFDSVIQKSLISPYLFFVCVVVILEVFIMFWLNQALNLRQQYYSTMARMLKAGLDLDEPLPEIWKSPEKNIKKSYKKRGLKRLYVEKMCWINDKSIIPEDCIDNDKKLLNEILAAENWMECATAPKSSKRVEIFMVVFLFGVVLSVITLSLLSNQNTKAESNTLIFSLIHVIVLSFIIWPYFVYPIWDRCKLRKIYWNDVKHIQKNILKVEDLILPRI